VDELFSSGRAADIIIAVLVIEALILFAIYRRTGRGLKPVLIASNLASGLCLVLALKGALTDAHWTSISMWLLAGFAAHGADLAARWKR
jgi:hypothetical protein